MVNGMDKDRDIERGQEVRASLLEDEQMSVQGAILQEKNFRLRKRNATKVSGRCKCAVAWLILRISMTRNEVDFDCASGPLLMTRNRPGRVQRRLVRVRNPQGQNCGRGGKGGGQQTDERVKILQLEVIEQERR